MVLDFQKILDKKLKAGSERAGFVCCTADNPKPSTLNGHVPMLHDDRYFFCSAVSVSILTFMEESFSLAMALSMASGTG